MYHLFITKNILQNILNIILLIFQIISFDRYLKSFSERIKKLFTN